MSPAPSRPLSRRDLLRLAALTGAGSALLPGFLSRALAASTAPATRTLVTLFLRGGADGLSLVPPVEDATYHRARPTLALRAGGSAPEAALKLDGRFGLHPALAPLLPLWEAGQLAVVHGVGLPSPTRSHFDAQDFVESGTPGRRSTPDGWLNRALDARAEASPFRAVALQPALPRALFGEAGALAMPELGAFRVRAGGRSEEAAGGFAALYAHAVDAALRTTGTEAFQALSRLGEERLATLPPANGAVYPRTPLARRLQDLARLVRGEVGLEVAATEMGGWDTHVRQGGAEGLFARRCAELAGALAAFATDLGPLLSRVSVVVLTEFGRTVRENGSGGTDHGVGSAMLVLGGGVRGGRVHGRFLALEDAHLQDGRDVPAWTDHRTVLAEVLSACRPDVALSHVFPDFQPPATPLGLFG